MGECWCPLSICCSCQFIHVTFHFASAAVSTAALFTTQNATWLKKKVWGGATGVAQIKKCTSKKLSSSYLHPNGSSFNPHFFNGETPHAEPGFWPSTGPHGPRTCVALVVMASIMGAYSLLNFIPVAALSGAGHKPDSPSIFPSILAMIFHGTWHCWRHHDCGGAPHLQMVLPGHGLGCRVAQVRPRSHELAPQGAVCGVEGGAGVGWERLHRKTMDGTGWEWSYVFI